MNKKKLTIDDVVSIKRHLMFKEMTQKEIAEAYGVTKSSISNIATNKTWSHVQIDEQGNYIDKKADDKVFQQIVQRIKLRKKDEITTRIVLDIKYVLMKEYFQTVSEVATFFKLKRLTVSDIALGKSWKEIKVNGFGERIKVIPLPIPEPVPDPILLENDEEKKRDVQLTEEEKRIAEIKEEFLEGLFDRFVNKKTFHSKIYCTNVKFNSWLHARYYNRFYSELNIGLEDFMSNAVIQVFIAVRRYNPPADTLFKWENLLVEDENSEKEMIFAYLIEALTHEIKRFMNLERGVKEFEHKKIKDGKVESHAYEYKKLDAESYDKPIEQEDGETSLLESLDGKSSFYHVDDSNISRKNHFLNWTNKNLNEIASPLQVQRFRILAHNELTDSYTDKQRQLATGISSDSFFKARRAIKESVIEAYEEEFGEGLNHLEFEKLEGLKLLEEYFSIVEDEDNEVNVSEWIVQKARQNEVISNLLSDKLHGDDAIALSKASKGKEIRNKTLNKINELFYQKYRRLKDWNTTANFKWAHTVKNEIDHDDEKGYFVTNVTPFG